MHVAILGITNSGKTTLAKRLAREYRARRVPVLVLDPMGTGWDCDYITDDPDTFLLAARDSRGCMLFIDEAGEVVGQWDREHHWLATRARHYGHVSHFISQRGVQIARTVRDQCTKMFLFRTGLADAKIHAEEWAEPRLKGAPDLPQGECFVADRFGKLRKINVFNQSGTKIAAGA